MKWLGGLACLALAGCLNNVEPIAPGTGSTSAHTHGSSSSGTATGSASSSGSGSTSGTASSSASSSTSSSSSSSASSTASSASSGSSGSSTSTASSSGSTTTASASSGSDSGSTGTGSTGAASTGTGSTSGTTGSGCALGGVLISQIRSRGAAGASDEFVELYNASGTDVTLDSSWVIKVFTTSTYSTHWTGAGQNLPAWGHFLIVGSAYNQTPAGDDTLSSNGISDTSSVILNHGNTTADAVCFYDTTVTLANAITQFATATCEGTPVSNAPHTNTSANASNVDSSIVRIPGGATGNNCTDSGDNATDFAAEAPAVPHNAASTPTP
ncbi:MAG: lamin tail domain-containing protein [Deltaproteobacteria bacterium]|nr:lamin tail domain-containing protein [Deltaproteobacteria bacterium]